jgi:Zn-dependent protease with chaperone function
MSNEKILAGVPGIILTRTRFQYAFRNGFLSMLITGKVGIKGSAPVQHVNAIEIVHLRASIFLCLFVFMLFLAVLACPASLLTGVSVEAGSAVLLLVPVAAFFLTFLFWLFYKQTVVILYSGGHVLVVNQLGGGDNRSRAQQMVEVYNRIKAIELANKPPSETLPQTGALRSEASNLFG